MVFNVKGDESLKKVYAYVVADILHHGHISHLRRARALGDWLTVGILTDKACMEKKPKPAMSFSERARVVASLTCVNIVMMQETYSPLENVKTIRPDILAESVSHPEQPANMFVRSYGGEVVVLPYTKGISSTLIKGRVINAQQKNQHK